MRGRRGLFAIAALVLLVLVAGGLVFSDAKLPLTATLEGGEDKAAVAQGEPAAGGIESTDQAGNQPESEPRVAEQEAPEKQETSGQPVAQAAGEQGAAEEQIAAERQYAEQIALQEQRAAEQRAAEQEAAEQAAAEQAAAEQRAAEQAAAEQAAAEQQYAQQVAAEQAAAEQAAAEQAAAEQAAAERAAGGQGAIEQQTMQPVQTVAPTGTGLGLTVPKIGLYGAPVTNGISESVLANGAGKIPSTGFPWQAGANTYIAGHVYGYPGTGSWQLFAGLPSLVQGDQISLTDSSGVTYEYRVTEILRVAPTEVWVTRPTGQNMVSLQTCVGPGWSERLIVRAVMV